MGNRVLVVEDDVRLARLIGRALAADGHSVVLAHDGEAALTQAAGAGFDVIVLDLMLPRLDGLEVCEALRGEGSEAAVLILTARDAVEDRVAGLEAGADDYLGKPFAFPELLARVRALGRRVAPGGLFQVGDLVLDPAARTVRQRGRTLELSAREFDLLEEFLRHPGRVLSRGRLLARIWGPEAEPASNIVDVYVHQLRKKLGGDSPMIRAVRGAGYILRPPATRASGVAGDDP